MGHGGAGSVRLAEVLHPPEPKWRFKLEGEEEAEDGGRYSLESSILNKLFFTFQAKCTENSLISHPLLIASTDKDILLVVGSLVLCPGFGLTWDTGRHRLYPTLS